MFLSSICFGQTSLKDINLKNGKYTVGFRHYSVRDSTRTYKRAADWNDKSILRPLTVSIWYPGTIDPRIKMRSTTVLDYMRILKEEEEWEHLPDEQILNWFYYSNTEQNKLHLRESSAAYRNLSLSNGVFPVIVYAPSYQASSIENFLLCEYLASNGYIVISTSSKGTFTRPMEGGTVRDMETQARDTEFLIKEAHKYKQADKDNIALMGFSFGGLSNTLVKMRNSKIRCVVSLDGSERYQYATLMKSPYFNTSKIDVPYIHLAQKEIPEQILKEDKIDPKLNNEFVLYDSLKNSKAYKLRFNNMTHAYFSTLGVLFQDRDKRQDKSDIEIMESYRWAAHYILNFLNATLKKDIQANSFLSASPEANGIKGGLMKKQVKEPATQPFQFEMFNDLAAAGNYDKLNDLYVKLQGQYPDLKIQEGNLNNLGLQLLFNKQTSQKGIKVLLFATQLYPQSANLFDSLAEAYLYVGNKQLAIINFKKSLQLDPGNQNAIKRLRELE